MITVEYIMSFEKDKILEASRELTAEDIAQLVRWLSLKDDNIRYRAFLLLQNRSESYDDVFPYWDEFLAKLTDTNSYQRSIGLMLLAGNVKWDSGDKTAMMIDAYLNLLGDEKNITVRQCIQYLSKIIPFKPGLNKKIADRLISLNLSAVKDTMRKLIMLDIINILLLIRKAGTDDGIEGFIYSALSGDILDKKSKKEIQACL